ncbi:small ubiquitin-related modifier [Nematocida minor]|uniref:small ubiquitin-related modifier n=1 Tax=Nematocida minor TaxID=1912983 RepID=UPI00221F7086|nr:small ubiquitin-related modifier [Nematocida minor]XP_051331910.1 small ubiquitin-related modifier [Nematocida minor]KAI5188737.1 small ubiquitin-related modifier [Nematocida minor]KAI5188744.1 small ubiquitin-related modifier [Nematocida minor]
MHIQEIKEENPKPTLQLKVTDQTQKTSTFVMKKKTKLSKLFKEYSERAELNAHKLRFVHKGVTLSGEDTPESVGLESGDLLEVFSSQVGGGICV